MLVFQRGESLGTDLAQLVFLMRRQSPGRLKGSTSPVGFRILRELTGAHWRQRREESV